jgi:ABC-type multidrug transport system ATPase subunit
LARAIAQNARLLILDEPIDDLDEPDKYDVMVLLLESARQNRQTVIAAMQDPRIGLLLADQLLIFDQNGIVADLDRQQKDFAAAAELALSKALPFHPEYKRNLGCDLPDQDDKQPEDDLENEKNPKEFIF